MSKKKPWKEKLGGEQAQLKKNDDGNGENDMFLFVIGMLQHT
jgi:hypothetical protein